MTSKTHNVLALLCQSVVGTSGDIMCWLLCWMNTCQAMVRDGYLKAQVSLWSIKLYGVLCKELDMEILWE